MNAEDNDLNFQSTSTATDAPRKRKRQRAIVSCTECHRRKQKCDRKEPCGNCLVRSAIHLCRYESASPETASNSQQKAATEASSSSAASESQGSSPSSKEDTANGDETAVQSTIGGSYGYTVGSCSNTTPADVLEKLNLSDGPGPSTDSAFDLPSTISAADYHRFISLIPPRPYVLLLVRVFFSECNWLYNTVNEGIFHLFLEEWYLTLHNNYKQSSFYRECRRELWQFPTLLLQVLAIALQSLPPEHKSEISHLTLGSTDFRALSAAYSNGSIELATLLSSSPATLPRVQAWTWRCSWLKTASRAVESWHAVGHAVREAQEIGLHKERPLNIRGVGNESYHLWRREEERRIWTTLYSFDRFMSVILGRPTMINDLHCTVAEPLNCDFPKQVGLEIPVPKGPDAVIPGEYTWRLFDARMSRLTPEIEALHSKCAAKGAPDLAAVAALQKKFEDFTEQFPPALLLGTEIPGPRPRYLTAQASLMHCTQNAMICCVHRPFIFTSTQSRTAILNASLNILSAQHLLFTTVAIWQRTVYGLNWFTFEAAVLLSAVIITEPTKGLKALGEDRIKRARDEMAKAVFRMGEIGKLVELAQNGAKVLESLRKRMEAAVEKFEEEMSVAEPPTPDPTGQVDSSPTPPGWEHLGVEFSGQMDFGNMVGQMGVEGPKTQVDSYGQQLQGQIVEDFGNGIGPMEQMEMFQQQEKMGHHDQGWTDAELNKWFEDSGVHAPQSAAWTFPEEEGAFWRDLLEDPVVL